MDKRLKGIITFLVLLVIVLQYRLWFGDGGIRDVQNLREELQRETEFTQALKDRNQTLEAEVQDLKQRLGALEERARTDLGMIREGETFYQHSSP